MSGRKKLLAELITRIVSLIDAGHQTKEISEFNSVSGGVSDGRWHVIRKVVAFKCLHRKLVLGGLGRSIELL